MGAVRCGPLDAIEDDLDETFFLQFLRVEVENNSDGPRQAYLPGGGHLDGVKGYRGAPAAFRPAPGKDLATLAKESRSLLAGEKGKRGPVVSRVMAMRNMLASGGLWQVRKMGLGGVEWLVGVQFRQTWKRTDLGAGRLIAAVPVGLYPSVKRIDLRIWNKTVETTRHSQSTESLYTTEVTASDKWSLATKKMFATETASDVNPSATINSIGVSVPGTVGVTGSGALGVSGSFRSDIKDQVDTTSDYIADETAKSASSLKSARSVEVSVTRESGAERTTSETLGNPNRGITLNYLYWEIIETYAVETKLDRIDPFLSVPLPIQTNVTREWLLQHECTIRPYIPCDKLAAGFEAAAASLKLEGQIAAFDAQLGQAGKETPAQERSGEALLASAAALIALYDEISTSNPANGRFGTWEYWGLVGIVAGNDLKRGLDTFKLDYAAAAEASAVADALDDMFRTTGALDDVFVRVKAAVASLMGFSALIGCGIVPPLGIAAVVLITALAVAADAIGVDLVPDDAGLEKAVRNTRKTLDAFRAASAAPPAARNPAKDGFDPELRAGLLREQLAGQFAEAQIALGRLSAHVSDEIYKYHHAIWAGYSASRIAQALRAAGVDPALAEHRFSGFALDRAYVRVTAISELERHGLEWRAFVKAAGATAPAAKLRTLRLPAPGAWCEAVRGGCDALDGFVSRHREVDLSIREALLVQREAEAAQARAETDRLEARVAAGQLDDPTPYRRADRLELELGAQEDGAATALTPAPAPAPGP